jgi:steroid 5-alpha reductase family enzyme
VGVLEIMTFMTLLLALLITVPVIWLFDYRIKSRKVRELCWTITWIIISVLNIYIVLVEPTWRNWIFAVAGFVVAGWSFLRYKEESCKKQGRD